jgi:MFS family permease
MNRWGVLALLFGARTVMAMQFQAIGAMSPFLIDGYGISLAEIGLLIGLYMSPGLFFALPGSAIGQRFGEKPVVVMALAMMAVGAAWMSVAPNWAMLVAGQVLAGLGGVLINVLLTKMVADWFAGAEITTALAIFINSWPVGIGLGLVVFPLLAAAFGPGAAFALLAALAFGFAVALAGLYKSPETKAAMPLGRRWPAGTAVKAALAGGMCWGAFNGGFAILFGLGTALLVEQGAGPEAAARQTSLLLWAVAVVSPFGGMLVDRTGQRQLVIGAGLAALAALSALVGVIGASAVLFVTFGVIVGLIAGPIMSLPAVALRPEERIIGMGLFFTVYYLALVAAPAMAGWLVDLSGETSAAFWLAALLQGLALASLPFARRS